MRSRKTCSQENRRSTSWRRRVAGSVSRNRAMRVAVSAGGASRANRWTRSPAISRNGGISEQKTGRRTRPASRSGIPKPSWAAREDQQISQLIQIVHHRVGRRPESPIRPPLLVEEGHLGADVEAGTLGLELVDVVYGADVVRPGRPGDEQSGCEAEIAERPGDADGVLNVLAFGDPGRQEHERPAVVQPELMDEGDGGRSEPELGTDADTGRHHDGVKEALTPAPPSLPWGRCAARIMPTTGPRPAGVPAASAAPTSSASRDPHGLVRGRGRRAACSPSPAAGGGGRGVGASLHRRSKSWRRSSETTT